MTNTPKRDVAIRNELHTPGPWARNISPKYPIYAEADHRKVAAVFTGNGVSIEEAMANLQLISCAPDLLAALEDLLDAVDTYTRANNGYRAIDPHSTEHARDTIAKATQS